MSKRKETMKRFEQLDQKIGRFTALAREFTNALYMQIQLEDLVTDYYSLLRLICLEQPLSSHLHERKKELEKIAEELGLADMQKASD